MDLGRELRFGRLVVQGEGRDARRNAQVHEVVVVHRVPVGHLRPWIQVVAGDVVDRQARARERVRVRREPAFDLGDALDGDAQPLGDVSFDLLLEIGLGGLVLAEVAGRLPRLFERLEVDHQPVDVPLLEGDHRAVVRVGLPAHQFVVDAARDAIAVDGTHEDPESLHPVADLDQINARPRQQRERARRGRRERVGVRERLRLRVQQ
mmetsp:Transcript_22270/g.76726  ORF Transcript_22270/g.76726 Transcript_22270/m.76726 type:complete len:207 (-) Transcript_22270:435-1055(-)